MISENIKFLRKQSGMTQKDLAQKLYVTSQAVSRWELGEVEPSITTIGEIANIFNVSVDEIVFGPNKSRGDLVVEDSNDLQNINIDKNTNILAIDNQESCLENSNIDKMPVLAVCEKCNKPIYNSNDIVRFKNYLSSGVEKVIYCQECYNKMQEDNKEKRKNYGIAQRKKSFIWGSVIGGSVLAIFLISTIMTNANAIDILFSILIGILAFTFTSCMFLKNNIVCDAFLRIVSWGFVKFPGIIFSFSLDGLIFLIGMKILFLILGFLLAVICTIFAFFVCFHLSLFVYPFAIVKSIKRPEETELI